jgi:predicted DCC family thiol-disulfide oxidoreductase YuxK
MAEGRLMLPDGRILGGAETAVFLARHIWWLWPLWFVSKFPGAMPIIRAGYRHIARNRYCSTDCCAIDKGNTP